MLVASRFSQQLYVTALLSRGMDRYGKGAVSLTIFLDSDGFGKKSIWTLSGEHGAAWHEGRIGISMDAEHSIMIEATVLQFDKGDIAIDDLAIVDGYCDNDPSSHVTSTRATSVPSITSSAAQSIAWNSLGLLLLKLIFQ